MSNSARSKLARSTRVTSNVRTEWSPPALPALSPRSTSNEREVITILSGVPENRAARAAAERCTKSSLRWAGAEALRLDFDVGEVQGHEIAHRVERRPDEPLERGVVHGLVFTPIGVDCR